MRAAPARRSSQRALPPTPLPQSEQAPTRRRARIVWLLALVVAVLALLAARLAVERARARRIPSANAGAASDDEPQKWVATELMGGLGNNLFQLAHLMTVARLTGRTPVLLEAATKSSSLAFLLEIAPSLRVLRVLRGSPAPAIVQEQQEYASLLAADPADARGVLLRGYWQAWPFVAAAFGGTSLSAALHADEAVDLVSVAEPARTRDAAPRAFAASYGALRGEAALHVLCEDATERARATLRHAAAQSQEQAQEPCIRVPLALESRLASAWLPHQPWGATAFVHFRRTDYATAWRESQVLPLEYYASAVRALLAARGDAATRVLVFSDDDAWAASESVRRLFPASLRIDVAPPGMSAAAVAVAMSLCAVGGVAANSTLSWWGATLGVLRAAASGAPPPLVILPGTWQTFAPADAQIWPPWASKAAVPSWEPPSRRAAHAIEPYLSPPRALAPARLIRPRQRALVINLDSRPDRWEACKAAWETYFELERLPAVATPQNGALGCTLSHVQALRMLEASGEETLLVLEDDATPTPRMSGAAWGATMDALARVTGWCVFNGGPNLEQLRGDALQLLPLKRGGGVQLFATPSALMSHMVLYHRRACPWIGVLEHRAAALLADCWYSSLPPVPVLVSQAVFAAQAASRSDITGAHADYAARSARSQRLLDKAAAAEAARRR